MMEGYISENNLKDLIGEALPVFQRFMNHQTIVVKDGQNWYPMVDYERWLDGDGPADEYDDRYFLDRTLLHLES